MIEEIRCKLCNNSLIGKCHGYRISTFICEHFKTYHSKEYEEIKTANRRLKALKENYGYCSDFII